MPCTSQYILTIIDGWLLLNSYLLNKKVQENGFHFLWRHLIPVPVLRMTFEYHNCCLSICNKCCSLLLHQECLWLQVIENLLTVADRTSWLLKIWVRLLYYRVFKQFSRQGIHFSVVLHWGEAIGIWTEVHPFPVNKVKEALPTLSSPSAMTLDAASWR